MIEELGYDVRPFYEKCNSQLISEFIKLPTVGGNHE